MRQPSSTLRRLGGVLTALIAVATILVAPPVSAGGGGCAAAPSFAGGTGAPSDPYRISTALELGLFSLSDQYWDDHLVLTADIDLAACPWESVGNAGTPFTGSFDGAGFTISNLSVNSPFGEGIGFFGVILAPGQVAVTDVNLVNVDIVGSLNVGALAGVNGAIISRSSATGKVTGGGEFQGNGLIGGLVGENGIRVDSDTAYGGTISYSWAFVDVTGVGGRFVGGLVGYNRRSSTIIDSYARGAVSAVSPDPEFGPVDFTAGFAGYNGIGSTVARSYSTGPTSSNGPDLGGFIGLNDVEEAPAGVVSQSFWDTATSGQLTSDGGTGESTTAMTSIVTYQAAGWTIVAGWAPFQPDSGVWGICPEVNDGYPYLLWEYAVAPCVVPDPDPAPAPEPTPAIPRFTG